MARSPYTIQPHLTQIALAYRNQRMIADAVLPRVPVGKQDFKYFALNKDDAFTVPSTLVGRRSQPSMVEFGGTETTASVLDYGLEDAVPLNDIENATPPFDPLGIATENLVRLMELDREVRVATAVFTASNYAAANKATLSGTSQWSDTANSNPVSAILAAIDAMIMRPNILVLGRAVYTQLIQHPKVVASALPLGGNASVAGKITRQALADLFELDEVLVGEGWVNSSRKGQTASYSRCWGKHAALIYRDQVAAQTSGTAFGFTASWQGKQVTTREDMEMGARGSMVVRAVDSVKEVITANDLGYLWTNAVA